MSCNANSGCLKLHMVSVIFRQTTPSCNNCNATHGCLMMQMARTPPCKKPQSCNELHITAPASIGHSDLDDRHTDDTYSLLHSAAEETTSLEPQRHVAHAVHSSPVRKRQAARFASSTSPRIAL